MPDYLGCVQGETNLGKWKRMKRKTETESLNGKLKQKAETEKLKFGNGRQKFNRLVLGQCAHRRIVVCVSRGTLTYMPN